MAEHAVPIHQTVGAQANVVVPERVVHIGAGWSSRLNFFLSHQVADTLSGDDFVPCERNGILAAKGGGRCGHMHTGAQSVPHVVGHLSTACQTQKLSPSVYILPEAQSFCPPQVQRKYRKHQIQAISFFGIFLPLATIWCT